MSISWIFPPVGTPVGPGFLVSVSSDFVGPIAAGSGWQILILDSTGEDQLMAMPRVLSQSHSFQQTLGVDSLQSWALNPAFGDMVSGENVVIRAQLTDSEGETIDSGSQTVVWDTSSGLPYLLSLVNARLNNLISGNVEFTTMQSDVADIRAASFAEFGSAGQLIPVSSLLSHPPLGFLRRELIGDFTGEGVIDNPGGVDRLNRFGMAWEILSAGEDLGINEGAPDTFELSVLDLQTVHVLADGNFEDSNRISVNFGDSMWLFEPMLPSVVRYWILPSVEIRLYWLVIVS